MSAAERGITVFVDIDGTQNRLAPPPVKTAVALFRGKLTLPLKDKPLEGAKPKRGVGRMLSLFLHGIRPFSRSSQEGLEIFKQTAQATERTIKLAVISGREFELHEMTRRRLLKAGRMDYLEEVRLSTVKSSSGFKEYEIRQEVEKGNAAVLVEDDLLAALRVERINEDYEDNPVLVYLLRNPSNAQWLRRRGNVELPENVVPVGSFQEAANDFAIRVAKGRF